VATYNVNSVRVRLPILREWLALVQPDALVLQETKVEDAKFPLADIQDMGYNAVFHGQQKYNGVAILSRKAVTDVATGLCHPDWPEDCRVQRAVVGDVLLINTYVPNGTAVGSDKFEYKLRWLDRFSEFVRDLAKPEDKVLWLGDINIAPCPEDVYDPVRFDGSVGYHPLEREALARAKEWGWVDCFRRFRPEGGQYTFWDFVIPNGFKRNLGWRIDHIYASPGLAEHCADCWIDRGPRSLERPSDHTPVVADFEL
jgi:exodeoxyribonuclease-3